jgi:hypothetical protein
MGAPHAVCMCAPNPCVDRAEKHAWVSSAPRSVASRFVCIKQQHRERAGYDLNTEYGSQLSEMTHGDLSCLCSFLALRVGFSQLGRAPGACKEFVQTQTYLGLLRCCGPTIGCPLSTVGLVVVDPIQ